MSKKSSTFAVAKVKTIRHIVLLAISIQLSLISLKAQTRPDSLALDSAQQALLDSLERMFTIQEVVVTAEEKIERSSASVINKEAMQHIQPSSFTDILQTLPGGQTKDPNLTSTNTIRLREATNGSTSSEYDAVRTRTCSTCSRTSAVRTPSARA